MTDDEGAHYEPEEPDGPPRLATVWDPAYSSDAASTISTTKAARVIELAQAEGLVRLIRPPFREDATWARIAEIHDPAYVQAVRTGEPRRLAESQGFRWSPAFAQSVARIWSGHTWACRLAIVERMVLHPVSGAHHARRASGGGYCTFNFLAGAARHIAEWGFGPVAIIDLDAHPGDGTYALVKDDPRIALFDIAGSAWGCKGDGARFEFHEAANARDFRAALATLPRFLDRVRPGLVQFQAGMDPFEDDRVGGIDGVTKTFLAWRDRFVLRELRARNIPVVVNLAGGYLTDVTPRLHVQTIRIAARAMARRGWRRGLATRRGIPA
jgi:acetoin utilization deacetylase AcuC-like enzyme